MLSIGRVSLKIGEPLQGLTVFNKALEIQTKNKCGSREMSESMLLIGRAELARKEYTRAL